MRKRVSSNDANQAFTSRTTNMLSGSFSDSAGTTGVPEFQSRVMEDEVTPNWNRRRAAGETIVNNMTSAYSQVLTSGDLEYTLQDENLDTTTGVWTTFSKVHVKVIAGYSARIRSPYTSIADRWNGSPTDRADVKTRFDFSTAYAEEDPLLLRVQEKATSSEALALVTVAELNKTIGLIHDLGRSAQRMDRALRRVSRKDLAVFSKTRFRDIRKLGLEIGSAWLQYRYGVMATYYDLASWVSAQHVLDRRRRRARFVSSTDTSYDSGDIVYPSNSNRWAYDYSSERFHRSTVSSAGCLTRLNLDVDSIDTHGVNRILTSAWELIPYSFVLDWFVDAGSRIAAAEGKYLRPILGSWIVHRHRLTNTFSREVFGQTTFPSPTHRATGIMSDWDTRQDVCEVVERKANPELSVLPHINIKLNWKRLADGLALLSAAASSSRSIVK